VTASRLVIDPGVLVSAALSAKAAPRRLLEAAIAGHITLVVSNLLLAELTEVLHRPKFQRRLTVTDVDSFVDTVTLLGERWPDPDRSDRQAVCRDPKDEYLIALAEAAVADFVVSGDRDLLLLGPVVVRTPALALAAIG